MARPFFSILLPTKSRHQLVAFAIQSVLDQDFRDFEIIVMDNDDEDLTRDVVARFKDPRVRYFRSGGLNMSQNWEAALGQAAGQYLTVLEDKQAYYATALSTMHAALKKTKLDVIVWEWDQYRDSQRRAIARKHSEAPRVISSIDILKMYVSAPAGAGRYMPRMLNSCVRREIIQQVQEHPNVRRFFAQFAPDLNAAFYVLSAIDEVCFLGRALGLVGYSNLSNAVVSRLGNGVDFKYYGTTAGREMALPHVPLKSFRLTYNAVYNDYLRVRSEIGGKLDQYAMTKVAYVKVCLWDVVRLYNTGASTSVVMFELRQILAYLFGSKTRPREFAALLLFVPFVVRMLVSKLVSKIGSTSWPAENIYRAVATDKIGGSPTVNTVERVK